jgi:ABC-type antimicrobial peptide transport system permease subunit
MHWPLRNKKVRGITAIALFLITCLVMLFFLQHESPEEKAIREWAGAPKRTLWMLWPIYLVLIGGACVLYILFFKVEERRQKYLGMIIPAATFSFLYLIPSESNWRWPIMLIVQLAIVLIAWLYPARSIRRQT